MIQVKENGEKRGKFEGVLICTDLDGTLLKNDKTISDENISAIEFFKQEGGIFTFITGRMPFYISDIYNRIKPNAPFGCINGGGLYDYPAQEYIWKGVMADGVMELVKLIDDTFPDVGIQVNTFHRTYFCKENQTMKNFRKITNAENIVCHYSDVKEPIAKIIIGSEHNGFCWKGKLIKQSLKYRKLWIPTHWWKNLTLSAPKERSMKFCPKA